MEPFWCRQWTVDCVDTKYRELSWKLFCRADVTAGDRTLAYSTLVYYQVPVASEQLLSSRQDKEEELAQQFEWIEEFMEGFRLVIVSCIEHRASSIFCWFNLSHPAAIKSALWLWILCAISSANVVQKRVKSEFRGIRPLTTNNLPVLRVHHCLLLVPGTWYCSCCCCSCWVGWPGKDGFTYRYATGIRDPGTRYFTGTRYQVQNTICSGLLLLQWDSKSS